MLANKVMVSVFLEKRLIIQNDFLLTKRTNNVKYCPDLFDWFNATLYVAKNMVLFYPDNAMNFNEMDYELLIHQPFSSY